MPTQLTVQVDRKIASIEVIGNLPNDASLDNIEQFDNIQNPNAAQQSACEAMTHEAQTQIELFSQATNILNSLIDRINQASNEVFTRHKEEIARLSVEIARKIIAQRVDKGDYDIEQIVREAINNTPTKENLVVHVNPEDHALLKLASGNSGEGDGLNGIKLYADVNIGRAECLIESPKGLIESRINEQLEQIEKALKRAQ